jgi:hypothetical protein
MSYTYTTFLEALNSYTNVAATGADANAAFVAAVPTIIETAELRIYTDLQLLGTVVTDASGLTTPNTRSFTLQTPAGGSGKWAVVQSINIVNGGVRTPVIKCSREVIDFMHPDDIALPGSIPNIWAPVTDMTVLLAPSPASALNVEIIGNIHPLPLSEDNPTTYLSTQLPSLFFTAAMIGASGWMRNFGAQADDPKLAISWSGEYDKMLPAFQGEEQKRKFQGYYGGA